ncbi:hypothetical protein NLJ89_g11191 [Agrocybe chaxingu]|uniref:Malate dehydrogenase n=1 Tax=Agrocybe chaxingu TaxID=84603 RepID=A0A9W8JPQ4_9AGAR|nr:hypothetical protein NLJ89_g11191 [Agrocybe chaxingu]
MVAISTLVSVALSLPLVMVFSGAVKPSGCDLSKAQIANLPSALTQPTTSLSFVAIAIGTQNYTCSSAGTYTNIGAVAELFDISCLYNTSSFGVIPDLAIGVWKAAPPSLTPQQIISKLQPLSSPVVLGEHYYVPNPLTGQGLNPEWNFSSHGRFKGNADAYVVAAKANNIAAPTGSQDIDWVSLKSLAGKLAQQVYRTDTQLGQPPASCTPGSPDITIRYASKYWLFGSSV